MYKVTRHCLILKAIRTFATKKTQRNRGNLQNKSKVPTFVSEEVSSASEGNVSTSLQVNRKDVCTDKIRCAPRSDVLQACTLTSGLLLIGGLVIRQVKDLMQCYRDLLYRKLNLSPSNPIDDELIDGTYVYLGATVQDITSHYASSNGWPIADPADVSFNFETWHLELVAGLVVLISSSRYILLQTWSEFRDSSEAANSQILPSLEPLDYIMVACLPGISEELLFRGALMPIFGLNWISALVIGAIFGVLHLGNGRRYSFAIWATFVGFAYGIGTIASSSVIVPMAAHSLNNIIGGLLWRFNRNSEKDI